MQVLPPSEPIIPPDANPLAEGSDNPYVRLVTFGEDIVEIEISHDDEVFRLYINKLENHVYGDIGRFPISLFKSFTQLVLGEL